MAIYVSKAPLAVEDVVRHHLAARRQILPQLPWADGPLPLGQSHYIYTGTREDLLNGRFLENARPTAWLYVIGSTRDPHGLAEVSCADRNGPAPPQYTSLHSAGVAKQLLYAVGAAEAMFPQMEYEEWYEMRILRAPSLSLLAVWLHGDEDLIFPVRSSYEVKSSLGRRRYLGPKEIEEALLPLANQRMHTSDRG